MAFGSWDINVEVNKFPQKVASALADLKLVGAEYNAIAYVGSQQVNGINHAVLAEQILTTGKDVKNVVLMIFNEKDDKVVLANIERIVESGLPMGGIQIDIQTEPPAEAIKAFNECFEGYVGLRITKKIYLGSQVTKGNNFIFFCEVEPVVRNPKMEVDIITVNNLTKDVSIVDPLTSSNDIATLGYAFTWLRHQNTSLGKPLGEWP